MIPACKYIQAYYRVKTWYLLTIFLMFPFIIISEGQDQQEYLNESEETATVLREKIKNEIKSLGTHEWAGTYYLGDGFGVNITLLLAPQSGFLFEWRGCLGLYYRNYGSVTSINDTLRFSLTLINETKGLSGMLDELVPVPWGKRKYLIPSAKFIDFCNWINSGSEPRNELHGVFLMREGDEDKSAVGMPIVPERFCPYLLSKPIAASIVSVGTSTIRPDDSERKIKDTPVVVDVGKDTGLLPGIELHVISPDNIVGDITITQVHDQTSAGIMRVFENEPEPKAGMKLSTRFRWLLN